MPITYEDQFLNLASRALGAMVLSASDEFFGARERLIDDPAPVYVPGKYDDNGKWVDGWETIRRRGLGHDHCIVALAAAGKIEEVVIDTSHFTGNYPAAASIEAARLDGPPAADTAWIPLLAPVNLAGDSRNMFRIGDGGVWTHLRLNIFPDGGVARLRVLGTVASPPPAGGDGLVELSAALAGGRAIACNDAHYGDPRNVLLPGFAPRMEDGWETRRRREPGNDWAVFALGIPGTIERIEVHTQEYKGNYPDACSLRAAWAPGMADAAAIPQSMFWPELLAPRKLGPDRSHVFADGLATVGPVTHVRLDIYPDGGVNRLRLFGRPAG